MRRAAPILLLISMILLLFSGHCLALRLFVGESEVELRTPLTMINGNFMIPLWVLEKHLDGEVIVDGAAIEVVFAQEDTSHQIILMRLDEESAQVDGQTYSLDVAPLMDADQIVVPLRFIADRRGLSLEFEDGIVQLNPPESAPSVGTLFGEGGLRGKTERSRERPPEQSASKPLEDPLPVEDQQVQDLQEIIFMGGPRARVFLDLPSYTGYQASLLTEPHRLMVDLFGISGEALPVVETGDPFLLRIRSSRFDEATMRVVFDLAHSVGYSITPWPEGGLEVEFNHRIEDFGLEQRDGFVRLWLEGSSQPSLEAIYLEDPLRLVLDFKDTTFLGEAQDLRGDWGRIHRLRANQHSPSITRVVLELTEPVTALSLDQEQPGRFVLPLFAGTALQAEDYLNYYKTIQPAVLPEREPRVEHQETPCEEPEALPEGSLAGLIIAIDPGHGGSDPGTIGYQGTFEKDVTLAIGCYLGEYLAAAGASVVYTRQTDIYVSIFDRPEIATEAEADLFISIHANSHLKRGTVRGTETLYRAGDPVSELLAICIQEELVEAITLINRRIWARDDLAVFNGSKMPAVLVEVGFLDHPDEEVLLRAEGFQKVAAEGILKGIERFYLEKHR